MKQMQFSLENNGTLELYLHPGNYDDHILPPRPMVLVVPGGGYSIVSHREWEPIAMSFYQKGYHAAVLDYAVKEKAANFNPLVQLLTAIKMIRENSREWLVVPDQIAVCGFSAGGHLVASAGTLWNHPEVQERVGNCGALCRPDRMILCYPVITSDPKYGHSGTINWVTGGGTDPEKLELFSLEKQVGPHTPPAFLWHTFTDLSVPMENSLLFLTALRREGIPFEYHVFPVGGHGLSLATEEVFSPEPHCAQWMELCCNWLKLQFPINWKK